MKICKLEVCDVKSICYESLYTELRDTNMHSTHISGNIETLCKLDVCDVKSLCFESLCYENL